MFALRDINLTKLESRPMRGRPWEYLFYVEVDARRDDLGCARALTHLAEFAKWTRVLGTYKGSGEEDGYVGRVLLYRPGFQAGPQPRTRPTGQSVRVCPPSASTIEP